MVITRYEVFKSLSAKSSALNKFLPLNKDWKQIRRNQSPEKTAWRDIQISTDKISEKNTAFSAFICTIEQVLGLE